jgi:hypothetical protein
VGAHLHALAVPSSGRPTDRRRQRCVSGRHAGDKDRAQLCRHRPSAGRLDGVAVGRHIGYNWQFGNFVYGLEADASWLSNKETEFNSLDRWRWNELAGLNPASGGVASSQHWTGIAAGPGFFNCWVRRLAYDRFT